MYILVECGEDIVFRNQFEECRLIVGVLGQMDLWLVSANL